MREAATTRSIKDAGKGGEVSIPAGGVHEPHLRRASQGGVRDYVLPGNKKYVTGDTIPRPEQGGGQSKASDSGEHCVTNGRWDLALFACENLADEERVTGCHRVDGLSFPS